ncbi:MAG: phosphohydrolase [Bacilli bacterium]|nr:phosphohydrolase [Bacilli bacterium]
MNFNDIAINIINNEKYKSLDLDYHHGLTRYKHIMHVARGTYILSKLLKLDYISATRGALLHDFFNEEEYLDVKGLNKPRIHPFLALNNSLKKYNLNLKEQNIIISHMYPIGLIKPLYLESWVVTIVDKTVATYEYLNYKFKDKFAVYILFILNFLNMKI